MHRRTSKFVYTRTVCFLLFSFALVLSMSLPMQLQGAIFDFRSIPLAIGSLYGGIHVAFGLYAILLLYRFLQDNSNQLIYTIAILSSLLFVSLYIRRFMELSLYRKMLAAASLLFLIRVTVLILYEGMAYGAASLLDTKTVSTMLVIMLQSLVCALYVFVFERLRSILYIQQEVLNSEKIKIVSEIAASVAHEIRNPLTSVRGFIQLLGEDGLEEGKRKFYQKICLEELDRAQLIISDYLTLAKPETETNEPIDLNREIAYIRNILLSYANYQNVEIACSLTDEPLWITGDKFKFRQALINIGKNAIEAMNGEGVLRLGAAGDLSGRIVIRIADNGSGMSAEQITRLGTPYYSTKERGTGLGTMVSFSIIKNMAGQIQIQSKIGKGTEYTLTFPGIEGPQAPAAAAEEKPVMP
ncbi:ATP-binding protein [Paenibacillus ginsengarvi]|uniref:ATP-binding protein n=1 Tax=Paenibacillus ginsengarvi TaxID=400777 RepID=UPI00187678BE|nr:ATP-binding protein [Paenibacillus ginsengarvi]